MEPKSFFAIERTFVQWASAALWLLTVAALITERESDTGGATYLTNTGIALCIGSIILLFHAIIVYFRRVKLLQTANPDGYVDKFGPVVLTGVVFVGVLVLLVEKTKTTGGVRFDLASTKLLHHEEGTCVLNSNEGVSALLYQPSDVAVDVENDLLLTVSRTHVFGHSKKDPTAPIRQLIESPGADFEGLTIAEGRIFALSPGNVGKVPILSEFAWEEDGERLWIAQQFRLGLNEGDSSEGITYVPGNVAGQGSLCIDMGSGQLDLYDLPSPTSSGSRPPLFPKNKLSQRMIVSGLDDGKIGALFFFEGVLYILHDNDMVIRSWDLSAGLLLSEMPLPRVSQPDAEHQWAGLAIERKELAKTSRLYLRGDDDEEDDDDDASNRQRSGGSSSSITVHLTLDSPPEVWSFSVREGNQKGELIFPTCAGANN
eukprot:scaffold2955_cov64-Cylindrotheca_fusiformis.AAC.2